MCLSLLPLDWEHLENGNYLFIFVSPTPLKVGVSGWHFIVGNTQKRNFKNTDGAMYSCRGKACVRIICHIPADGVNAAPAEAVRSLHAAGPYL